jgi:hypothetical protein
MYANIVDSLKNSNMNFLDDFVKFLRMYKDSMKTLFSNSSFLSDFPSMDTCLRTQSEVESLSKSVKELFQRVICRDLTFSSNRIMPPQSVPTENRTYFHYPGPTIYVCADGDCPHKIANDIASLRLREFRKSETKPDDHIIHDTRHQARRKNGGAAAPSCDKVENLPTNQGGVEANCLVPSISKTTELQRLTKSDTVLAKKEKDKSNTVPVMSSPDDADVADVADDADDVDPDQFFERIPDEKNLTLDSIMKYADSISREISITAPSPKRPDILKFAQYLFTQRSPCWKEIIRNFVIGVVVMEYEMPSEMTALCLELLCTGRLVPVVQELRFDFTSMNLEYRGDLRLIFMSEVSHDYCRQMIGRCGRVSDAKYQGIGIVMCQTPSGLISLPETVRGEKKPPHQDEKILRCSIGNLEDFGNSFSRIPKEFLTKIFEFLSSCRLDEKDVSFFRNLLTLFQEVLYNHAFKFCCSDNKIDQIMTFLSCTLIVISGTYLEFYHVDVDSRLRSLALNDASTGFNYTQETFKGIKDGFVREVRRMLGDDQLQSIFGLLRIMQDKNFKFCSHSDLSRMFLNFRGLSKLSELMKKFLFNLHSPKNSHEFNRSINALLTMLSSFEKILDELMIIIMSYSIPCSTVERANLTLSGHEITAGPQCFAMENPFVSLTNDIHSGPPTLAWLSSCLLRYSLSGRCVKCNLGLRDFKRIFSCDPSSKCTSANILDGQIDTVLRGLKADLSHNNKEIQTFEQKVRELDTQIQSNAQSMKGIALVKANRKHVDEKKMLIEIIPPKKERILDILSQIKSLELELSPYRGLSEADAVALFIQRMNQ